MGGKSSDSEQTQTVIPWPGAQPHMLDIFSRAQNLVETGQPAYYPGQTFAPRDPLQDQAQNARLNYGVNALPGQINQAQNALGFALNAPNIAANPYVQDMMGLNERMLNRNLQENILPGIDSGAVQAGAYGGSRQGIAQGQAIRGTQEAIGNANAQMAMDAYGKGLGAQGIALGMAPNIANFGFMPMDVMSQTGAYNRGIDQEALSADMDRWNYLQNLPWDNLNKYGALVSGNNAWGSATTTDGGGSSPLSGAIGGGLAGYSLGSAFLPFGMGGPIGAIGGALLGGLLS